MMTGVELVEVLAKASYAVACMEDRKYSGGNGVVYVAARLALRAAIIETYPGMDVEQVVDMWIDCGESIAYCVDYIARNDQELARLGERYRLEDLIENNPRFQ